MVNRSGTVALLFFVLGCAFAIAIQIGFSWGRGCNISAVVNVGEDSPIRSDIQKELSNTCLASGIGHDGIWTYLLARDPLLLGPSPILIRNADESVTYRGRRILFSWLGGAFGTLGPYATVWGLVVVGAIGVGLATFVFATWVNENRLSPLLLFCVFLNIGLISSLVTLTSDHVALGLALFALFLGLRERLWPATVFFALAALTKETYLLAAVSFYLIQLRRGFSPRMMISCVMSVAPLVMWLVYLNTFATGEPTFAIRQNITWPFLGMIESAPEWRAGQGMEGQIHLIITLLSTAFVAFLVFSKRSIDYALLATPWILLMICLGKPVWDVGNNAARAGSMIFVLIGLSVVQTKLRPHDLMANTVQQK